MDTARIQATLADFASQRDWDKFHTPKNLSTALVCEAGELAELFQWMTGEESAAIMDTALADSVRDEMADVLLYLLRLADKLDVDLESAALAKIKKNGDKYPVHLSKGNADKYTRRKN